MTTKTFYFTGSVQQWTVPENVFSVTMECRGGEGGSGGSGSGQGGLAEGRIAVSAGDTLYIYVGEKGGNGNGSGGWPNGGDGQTEEDGWDTDPADTSRSGGGGGSSEVRLNGTNVDDRIIVAGGGGGGADLNDDGWVSSTGGGGHGGGDARDGGDAYVHGNANHVTADGGTGGGQSTQYGEDATGSTDSSDYTAATGAGGGGANGGSTGEIDRYNRNDDEDIGAAGGGGGDGYLDSSLTETNEYFGQNSGHGTVVLTYTDTQPQNFVVDNDPTSEEAYLSWEVDSSFRDGEHDFYVYRSTASGFTPSSSTRVATLSGSNRSYTDTDVTRGETYYYRLSSYHVSSERESSPSIEQSTQIAHMAKVAKGGSHTEYPIRAYDADADAWIYPSNVQTYDESSDSWE